MMSLSTAGRSSRKGTKNMKTQTERAFAALEYLRSVTNRPRLEVQQVSLLVALYDLPAEGVTMQDLAKEVPGVTQSFISRNASAFGVKSKPGAERLVGLRIGDDVRFRIIHFLPAGRKVIDTFVGILEGTMDPPAGMRPAVDRRTK